MERTDRKEQVIDITSGKSKTVYEANTETIRTSNSYTATTFKADLIIEELDGVKRTIINPTITSIGVEKSMNENSVRTTPEEIALGRIEISKKWLGYYIDLIGNLLIKFAKEHLLH
jgi:hypothetical protein